MSLVRLCSSSRGVATTTTTTTMMTMSTTTTSPMARTTTATTTTRAPSAPPACAPVPLAAPALTVHGGRVLGVGTDVCHVGRVARVHAVRGERFERKFLHDDERAQLASLPVDDTRRRATFLASRWAAKEAVFKATAASRARSSCAGESLPFTQLCVRSSSSSSSSSSAAPSSCAPTVRYVDDAARIVDAAGVRHTHLSLSHDGDYALAFVVVEGAS